MVYDWLTLGHFLLRVVLLVHFASEVHRSSDATLDFMEELPENIAAENSWHVRHF